MKMTSDIPDIAVRTPWVPPILAINSKTLGSQLGPGAIEPSSLDQ